MTWNYVHLLVAWSPTQQVQKVLVLEEANCKGGWLLVVKGLNYLSTRIASSSPDMLYIHMQVYSALPAK